MKTNEQAKERVNGGGGGSRHRERYGERERERQRDKRERETVRRGKTVRQNKKRATQCDCVMTWL